MLNVHDAAVIKTRSDPARALPSVSDAGVKGVGAIGMSSIGMYFVVSGFIKDRFLPQVLQVIGFQALRGAKAASNYPRKSGRDGCDPAAFRNFSLGICRSVLLIFVFAVLLAACSPERSDYERSGGQNNHPAVPRVDVEGEQVPAGFPLPAEVNVTGLAAVAGAVAGPEISSPRVRLGTNVSWFTTWSEAQPLANVFPTGRGFPDLVPLDSRNEPTGDFQLLIYEGDKPGGLGGVGGGAQTGEHKVRFNGKASVTAHGGNLGSIRYDTSTNTTRFTFTTTKPGYATIRFTDTRRLPTDDKATGLRNIEIMRPGHQFGDLLNSAFVEVMEPFSVFRTSQNWDEWTYNTSAPVWAERAKPGGMYSTTDGITAGGAPWEILAAMANELEKDLWISLPPNADDSYMTSIFRTFFYGSDGINPYTGTQENPVWAPLDPQRKLYFEVGNEIWNYAHPFGEITNQMTALAEAEFDADDPYDYGYADPGYRPDKVQLMRLRVARLTAHASQLCRDIVGDGNMMQRFRPVLSGQLSWSYPGLNSLSYLKIVLGGHDWYRNDWSGDRFHGRFVPNALKTPEDGVSVNQFGNLARPLSYWIYGYAVAPYVDWTNAEELKTNLKQVKLQMVDNGIELARQAKVEALAYEGGVGNHTTRHDYREEGLYELLVDLLGHWYESGGGLFMNYSLAGNNGQGAIPDLTRQDPAEYPKIRALRHIAGLP